MTRVDLGRIAVDIDICCSYCKAELLVTFNMTLNTYGLQIKPCEKCLKTEFERGFYEGILNAQKEGLAR